MVYCHLHGIDFFFCSFLFLIRRSVIVFFVVWQEVSAVYTHSINSGRPVAWNLSHLPVTVHSRNRSIAFFRVNRISILFRRFRENGVDVVVDMLNQRHITQYRYEANCHKCWYSLSWNNQTSLIKWNSLRISVYVTLSFSKFLLAKIKLNAKKRFYLLYYVDES